MMRLEEMGAACLPVIDIGVLTHRIGADRSLVIDEIRKACKGLGCFKIINHGISSSVTEGALEVASDFFKLSKEEKAEYASEDIHLPVRYGASMKPRDFIKQYAHPLGEWSKFWPSSPDYRQKMGKYAMEVRRVTLQLMDAILESLGLGEGYMADKFEEGMQVMTVNNYEKPSPEPDSTLGMAAHTDYGCLTILLQSSEGLQIVDNSIGAWRAVPELPGALHVHIGDYLEVLSNGQYRSVVHRVVLDAQRRMSIASIHSLSMDEMVTPAKELVDEQHPKGYRGSNFRDVLRYITNNDFTNGGSFINSLRILAP
ncbi:protein DOWNY MILDEW RESISTANCE 6-like [Iris pallida]|uniref:Protein DOWNY MILDEW RESISTANCE 6-like n=1 Tax=Iris pallida TaxID=29817 RepID=A0AAX6EK58_IRIPA|nr:protein DOWNY MILDEW RESISTANCE 6-like [Iris pallida]